MWNCECSCGNKSIVQAYKLTSGNTQSCGCYGKEKAKEANRLRKGMASKKLVDITGKRYGRLTVIGRTTKIGKDPTWNCICDCGNTCIVQGNNLKNGHTKSCGCYVKDIARKNFKVHGKTNTRIFNIWVKMKQRCTNKDDKAYAKYGGRGIKVCEEWINDFQAFYDWSMSNGYADDLSIDRIDNDGNYEPSNCRWATDVQQSNNRRSNHYITCNGETHTIAEWSKITGINDSTIQNRAAKGWKPEKILGYES